MFVQLMVNNIQASKTTESGPFNDRDEVYFVAAGSTSRGEVRVPRVSPPAPEDYYGLKRGQHTGNIQIWQGYLADGEYAYITVIAREQDNAQLSSITSAVKGGALAIAAIFVDPGLGPAALNELGRAASQFVDSLAIDGDQTLGAISVRLSRRGDAISAEWMATTTATLVNSDTASADFHLTGSDAKYIVRLGVQRPQLPMIVNRNSGKCLDVIDASLDNRANVQQYSIHGNGNQRWFLKYIGPAPAFPVSPVWWPAYAIIAEHSGKALDVVDASMKDGANVQQSEPHFGGNQQWILVPDGGDFIFLNFNSRKVLDVVNASTSDQANVQQYKYHGGLNQRWRLRT